MAKDYTPAKFGFYRPHKPVGNDGSLVNHVTGEVYTPPSMTKQSFVAECDINNVLEQYKETGVIRHVSSKAEQGAYLDLPDPIDFQDALHVVQASEAAFATLPSNLRTRFNNDPAEFLAFVTDPANADELVKLGLANAPPQAPPQDPPLEPEAPPSPPQA